jgi:hypothetical protein
VRDLAILVVDLALYSLDLFKDVYALITFVVNAFL